MKRAATLFAALAAAAVAGPALANGPTRFEAGLLDCVQPPSSSFLIGSDRDLSCTFTGRSGVREVYRGSVTRLGVDISSTASARFLWYVLAVTEVPGPGALSGRYYGASAEATLGVGPGAAVLTGGSGQTITLQPIAVQGQTGLGVGAGLTVMRLYPEVAAYPSRVLRSRY